MSSSISAPSRRSVVRAAAWTAPAVSIAVAAPAYANCSPGQVPKDVTGSIAWATQYNAVSRRATTTLADGTSFGVGISSTFGGVMTPYSGTIEGRTYDNLGLSPHNVGGLGHQGLTLAQIEDGRRARKSTNADQFQTVLLTFDQAVKNLKFTVTDIDQLTTNHSDRVFVTPAGSGTFPAGGVVTGSGTAAQPWRNSATYNTNLNPETSNLGNVTVNFGATASQTFSVTFYNDNDNRGVQQIFIGNLEFAVSKC